MRAHSRTAFARLGRTFGLVAMLGFAATGFAQTLPKVVFLTNWFAEAEHGGFYQAVAEGTYKRLGLDVEVKMGGPQVNVVQLLLAGQADLVMGYDLQTIKLIEQGLPVVTVGATFQKDPAVLIAHPDVKSLADLKTRTLLIGQASEITFWPWAKVKYGYTDAQKRPYAFSVQQFLVDKNIAQQGYRNLRTLFNREGRREAGCIPARRCWLPAVCGDDLGNVKDGQREAGHGAEIPARHGRGMEKLPGQSGSR